MYAAVPNQGIAWKPGFARHVPWLAFVSILGFVACCAGLGAVLWLSDEKDITTWPTPSHRVPVSVLLSLLVSVGNLLLLIALGQGYSISWWLQALKGAELKKMQFDLHIQSSVVALFSRSASLDKFAIAAVISLIVSVADGPLIQKASTIGTQTYAPIAVSTNVHVTNASFPADFSGASTITSGDVQAVDMLTPIFRNVSRAYANREDIKLAIDGCTSNVTCALTLPAPGFDVECTERKVDFDFGTLAAAGPRDNYTTFSIDVEFGRMASYDEYSSIRVTSLYKPHTECSGQMIRRKCTLRLSTVQYDITVKDGAVSMSNWELGQNDTLEFTRVPGYAGPGTDVVYTGSFGAGGLMTMLGGVASVVKDLFSASVNLRISVMMNVPYFVSTTGGQAGSNYLTSDISTYNNCTMTWEDPTADLVNTLRELMLRSAIASSTYNSSAGPPQQLSVQQTKVAAAYESHYLWLIITVACMVAQMLVIFFLLLGWQRLGRDVSLDAFDIARALGAPVLQVGSSNSAIKEGLAPLGGQKFRYGELLFDDATSSVNGGIVKEGEAAAEARQGPRLVLDQERRVGDIRPGVLY